MNFHLKRNQQIRRNKPVTAAGEVPEPQVENTVAETPSEQLQDEQEAVSTAVEVPDEPEAPETEIAPETAPVSPRKRSKRQTQTQAEQPQS